MKKNYSLMALSLLFLVISCSKESPELFPCMCDGSDSTLGLFDCMCEPMSKKPVKRFSYLQDTQKYHYQTLIVDDAQQDAYLYLHQNRSALAPIKLEYVDFRINKNGEYENYNTKLGNYKFRIFGCRRENKNVFLNKGRAMQKDMKFTEVFFETMNDYYPVVVEKTNPYYLNSDRIEYPEYLITAEITDYFMNICDEFDWKQSKTKKLRSGSSEMNVVWRVMSLDKNEVYCKGMTTGYGQISEGEPKGETLLVERAFEDALTKLPEIECFNTTLAQRIHPQEIAKQLAYLQNIELKDGTFAGQYANTIQGVNVLQKCIADKVFIPGKQEVVLETVEDVTLEPVPTETVTVVDENCHMAAIDEQSRTIVTNLTEKMTDNVKIVDDYWVDVPLDTDDEALIDSKNLIESSFANIDNKFCIKNQPPYENLNPHNLYKIRASIVAVENAKGQKGSGLIIADNLVLTSADIMVKNNNNFKIKTINGKEMKGAALRVNPNKNVAVLLLDTPTKFTPLPLSLQLPEINKDILMTIGLLDPETEGEGYLDNEGKVIGYRWSDSGDAEIIVDTFVQTVSIGGALIDKHGNIVGMAHKSKKVDDNPDLFIPIENALKSLGLEICGREFGSSNVAGFKTYETPLADAIDNSKDKTPLPMKNTDKK